MNVSNPKDKFSFLLLLSQRAKEEKSPYTRLIFQENMLVIYLIVALRTIERFLNRHATKHTLTDERKLKIECILKVEFKNRELESKTIGQLFAIIKPFLANNDELKSYLEEWSAMRNRITHNMFSKYGDMAQLDNDSQKVLRVGEKVIDALNIFRKKISEETMST